MVVCLRLYFALAEDVCLACPLNPFYLLYHKNILPGEIVHPASNRTLEARYSCHLSVSGGIRDSPTGNCRCFAFQGRTRCPLGLSPSLC
jgi:hypothetical protein